MPPTAEIQQQRMREYRLRKKTGLVKPKSTLSKSQKDSLKKKQRKLKILERNELERINPQLKRLRLAAETPKRYSRGYTKVPKTSRKTSAYLHPISWTKQDLIKTKKNLRKISVYHKYIR